jgi:hypothetical protein
MNTTNSHKIAERESCEPVTFSSLDLEKKKSFLVLPAERGVESWRHRGGPGGRDPGLAAEVWRRWLGSARRTDEEVTDPQQRVGDRRSRAKERAWRRQIEVKERLGHRVSRAGRRNARLFCKHSARVALWESACNMYRGGPQTCVRNNPTKNWSIWVGFCVFGQKKSKKKRN